MHYFCKSFSWGTRHIFSVTSKIPLWPIEKRLLWLGNLIFHAYDDW